MIAHADLHVHSKYSGISHDWYLRLVQSSESYSEVETIFFRALKRGQTFVTITDHDQIEGSIRLKEIYPSRVFTGVEFNVYFPEDCCKVHILVYGLSVQDYKALMALRQDIYQFRDYLKQANLAYSVAHALMALDKKLSRSHLEKLILLFDVFEGINGSQLKIQNQTWIDTLRGLTPARIGDLYHLHHIEPISCDPWIKGITGGSDDHADLYIGRTFTEAKASNVEEYLEAIRTKRTASGGAHSTFRDLSMSVIKIAYETARRQPNSPLRLPLVQETANHVFDGQPVSYKTRLKLKYLQWYNWLRPDPVRELMTKLIEHLLKGDFSDANVRAVHTYECLTFISDEAIMDAIQKFSQVDPVRHSFYDRLKSPLAGIMLSAPFFTALGFMHASRHLVKDFRVDNLSIFHSTRQRRVLWFSDDKAICEWVDGMYDRDIIFISHQPLPNILLEKQLLLPIIGKLSTGEDADTTIHIPSLLQSLEQLADLQPDEIIISTAGPVGLMGLLLSRLLKVPSVGIPKRSRNLDLKDPQMAEMVELFNGWFFAQLDQIIETRPDCYSPVQALPVQPSILEPV
jgi:predicted metal-dependent phosphoesterase TrpH